MLSSRSPLRFRPGYPRAAGALLCFALASVALASCAQPRSRGRLPPGSPAAQGGASGQRSPAEGPSPAALQPLRVASWNLEWLHAREGAGPVPRSADDYARLRKYAERLAADVVAVQEVDGAEALERVFHRDRYELQLVEESGQQRGGFAIRRGLDATRHPDVVALNTTGGLRSGVDVSVRVNGASLRLLGVHLKSGCFDAPLHGPAPSCRKLRAQLPQLERWIDTRAAEGEAFVVLGDFNRHLRTGDAFYSELDDGEPPNADLTLLTDGRKSGCWAGRYPNFIDHIAISRNVVPWLVEGSFAQQLFDEADAPHRRGLSDHCPISIVLRPGAVTASSAPPSSPLAATPSAPPPTGSAQALPAPAGAVAGRIKGNVSSRGKKLYHAPGCPQYERVRINPNKGERSFASEAEAVAAGWQKAPGCP